MHDILKSNHDGPCGGHFSGKRKTYKILHLGHYWPTLFRDSKSMFAAVIVFFFVGKHETSIIFTY